MRRPYDPALTLRYEGNWSLRPTRSVMPSAQRRQAVSVRVWRDVWRSAPLHTRNPEGFRRMRMACFSLGAKL